jgi:hypothetical protein
MESKFAHNEIFGCPLPRQAREKLFGKVKQFLM